MTSNIFLPPYYVRGNGYTKLISKPRSAQIATGAEPQPTLIRSVEDWGKAPVAKGGKKYEQKNNKNKIGNT